MRDAHSTVNPLLFPFNLPHNALTWERLCNSSPPSPRTISPRLRPAPSPALIRLVARERSHSERRRSARAIPLTSRCQLCGSGGAAASTRARTAALIGAGRRGQAETRRFSPGSDSFCKHSVSEGRLSPHVLGLVRPCGERPAGCKSAIPGSNPGGLFFDLAVSGLKTRTSITRLLSTRPRFLFFLADCPSIGWAMAEHVESRLVVDALAMAVQRRLPNEGLLTHSDRGSQYAREHYQLLLAKHGIPCSMSRLGDCWDNALMKSLFRLVEVGIDPRRGLRHAGGGAGRDLRVHQGVLQWTTASLLAGV